MLRSDVSFYYIGERKYGYFPMSAAEPSTTVTTDTSLKSHAGDWESHTLNQREYNTFIDKVLHFLEGIQEVGGAFITTEMEGYIRGDGGIPISHITSQKRNEGGDTRADIVTCELLSPGRMKVKINRECDFYRDLGNLMGEAITECHSIPGGRRGMQRHYTLLNEQVPEFSNRVVAHFAAKNIPLIQGKELPSSDGQYLQLSLPYANGSSCKDDKWRILLLTKNNGHVQQQEIANIRSLGGHSQLNMNYDFDGFKDMVLLMQEVKRDIARVGTFSEEHVARDTAIRSRAAKIRLENQPKAMSSEQEVLPETVQKEQNAPVSGREWAKRALEKLLPVRLAR